jgi:hypothetical protein
MMQHNDYYHFFTDFNHVGGITSSNLVFCTCFDVQQIEPVNNGSDTVQSPAVDPVHSLLRGKPAYLPA